MDEAEAALVAAEQVRKDTKEAIKRIRDANLILDLSFLSLPTLPPLVAVDVAVPDTKEERDENDDTPASYAVSPRLTTLNLHGNALDSDSVESSLSSALSSHPSGVFGDALVEVFLSSNALTSFPLALASLPSLLVLNLSHNNLASLPPEMGGLTSLTHLYVEHNALSALPPEVVTLPSLSTLRLAGNNALVDTLPRDVVADTSEEGDAALLALLRNVSSVSLHDLHASSPKSVDLCGGREQVGDAHLHQCWAFSRCSCAFHAPTP